MVYELLEVLFAVEVSQDPLASRPAEWIQGGRPFANHLHTSNKVR